jgi:hypothetical protein
LQNLPDDRGEPLRDLADFVEHLLHGYPLRAGRNLYTVTGNGRLVNPTVPYRPSNIKSDKRMGEKHTIRTRACLRR